jgi:hypothetical protein
MKTSYLHIAFMVIVSNGVTGFEDSVNKPYGGTI